MNIVICLKTLYEKIVYFNNKFKKYWIGKRGCSGLKNPVKIDQLSKYHIKEENSVKGARFA